MKKEVIITDEKGRFAHNSRVEVVSMSEIGVFNIREVLALCCGDFDLHIEK